jgi:hypothetical protein
MARIEPVSQINVSPALQKMFDDHVMAYNTRITNMKATLAHSETAFEIYMHWYPLYEEVKKILGERLAYLFAWSLSYASNCPLCTTYFRKVIIEKGEDPERLQLSALEKEVLDFGSAIATNQGHVDDEIYNKLSERFSEKEMVVLIAFAGQMIATNIFNNVIRTAIDDYLTPYLPKSFLANGH